MNGYTNQYLANTVNSASPEQLMLMLYDGAIRFLGMGIQAIEKEMIDKRAYYINKASAIISEFAATLDHSQDANLAENLDALYNYMLGRLQDANVNNDTEPLEEVKTMLSDLRGTWAQAIELNKQDSKAIKKGYAAVGSDVPPAPRKSFVAAM
ncbi:flagellar export chaperone FliS [Desulfogranum marinum]|uniref:flagellar export chaperone FliS n=1 Tax=Desulfogranum marinum TaxID=453220 RepID=UPI0019668DC0|nr:flagellar export chaperone FliS [Desulfogranum marinum]MBM9513150.1 flagellar export chaperone FliS [Desulfogranum marinum]